MKCENMNLLNALLETYCIFVILSSFDSKEKSADSKNTKKSADSKSVKESADSNYSKECWLWRTDGYLHVLIIHVYGSNSFNCYYGVLIKAQ